MILQTGISLSTTQLKEIFTIIFAPPPPPPASRGGGRGALPWFHLFPSLKISIFPGLTTLCLSL